MSKNIVSCELWLFHLSSDSFVGSSENNILPVELWTFLSLDSFACSNHKSVVPLKLWSFPLSSNSFESGMRGRTRSQGAGAGLFWSKPEPKKFGRLWTRSRYSDDFFGYFNFKFSKNFKISKNFPKLINFKLTFKKIQKLLAIRSQTTFWPCVSF